MQAMAAVSTYSNGREYNSPRTQDRDTNQWDFKSSKNQEVAGIVNIANMNEDANLLCRRIPPNNFLLLASPRNRS